MQSDLPKVLHPIAGKSMLGHVLDSARALRADNVIAVIGHGAEQVQNSFAHETSLQFAIQDPQRGTGHAVQQAEPLLSENQDNDVTLVLYGDVPLVQPETLRRLLASRGDGVAILT